MEAAAVEKERLEGADMSELHAGVSQGPLDPLLRSHAHTHTRVRARALTHKHTGELTRLARPTPQVTRMRARKHTHTRTIELTLRARRNVYLLEIIT